MDFFDLFGSGFFGSLVSRNRPNSQPHIYTRTHLQTVTQSLTLIVLPLHTTHTKLQDLVEVGGIIIIPTQTTVVKNEKEPAAKT